MPHLRFYRAILSCSFISRYKLEVRAWFNGNKSHSARS